MASVVYSFVSREAVADNFAIGGRVLEVEVRSSVFVRARVRGYLPTPSLPRFDRVQNLQSHCRLVCWSRLASECPTVYLNIPMNDGV